MPRFLKHPVTGAIQPEEKWLEEMPTWQEHSLDQGRFRSREQQFADLIEVVEDENGEWVAVGMDET
jgi:hypothetical protein